MADRVANTNRNREGRKIDLNTATQEELERISDFGSDYARRIIEERDRRGGFDRLEDLDDVEGIGAETIAQLHRGATIRERTGR